MQTEVYERNENLPSVLEMQDVRDEQSASEPSVPYMKDGRTRRYRQIENEPDRETEVYERNESLPSVPDRTSRAWQRCRIRTCRTPEMTAEIVAIFRMNRFVLCTLQLSLLTIQAERNQNGNQKQIDCRAEIICGIIKNKD